MTKPTRARDSVAPAARPHAERAVTLGNYRLMAKLGTGGMADVYLAVAQGAMNVNRLVVVKRLRDEQAGDESAREMFLNEARLAARLNHANVIQTFEAGHESGSYYLTMEYVEGQPLSRVLTKLRQEERRVDMKIAARVCADALAGLHYAHELADFDGSPLKIVHRDVSPQNIMLTYAGVTKIVDFGIAKAAGSTQTAHGVFKGKVAYMAPEQVLGEDVDGRADVFAAGIVLWEAVTGKHLMAGDTPAKTLHNLMNKAIPRASEVLPEVPAALDAILAKALERDVELRYASAKAMRDALEGWLTSVGGAPAEEVGALVSSLFEDRKRTVQQQVKAQLAALSLSRASEPKVGVSQMHVRTDATLIDLSEGATPGSYASMFRVVSTGSGIAPETPGLRAGALALGAITLLALGVSGFALYCVQHAPAATTEVAPVTTAPPATAATAATAATEAPVAKAAAPTATAASEPPAVTATARHVAWAAPARATAPAARPASTAPAALPAAPPTASDPSPPAASPSAAKPAETSTGRTFRRSL